MELAQTWIASNVGHFTAHNIVYMPAVLSARVPRLDIGMLCNGPVKSQCVHTWLLPGLCKNATKCNS